jgi:hypothetical protein
MRRRPSLLVPAGLALLKALAGGVVAGLRSWLPWLQRPAGNVG